MPVVVLIVVVVGGVPGVVVVLTVDDMAGVGTDVAGLPT